MKLEAKNIGILGLGKSGYWSAKLATSMDYKVFISDSNTIQFQTHPKSTI